MKCQSSSALTTRTRWSGLAVFSGRGRQQQKTTEAEEMDYASALSTPEQAKADKWPRMNGCLRKNQYIMQDPGLSAGEFVYYIWVLSTQPLLPWRPPLKPHNGVSNRRLWLQVSLLEVPLPSADEKWIVEHTLRVQESTFSLVGPRIMVGNLGHKSVTIKIWTWINFKIKIFETVIFLIITFNFKC